MTYGTLNVNRVAGSGGGSISPDSSVFRNRIINGDMRIDQRNAGASVTLGSGTVYTLDRFAVQSGSASKLSAQQNAGSVTPPTGFRNYLGLTSLSAYSVGAGEIFAFRQYIEGFNVADLNWGTASAATVTLSFWVRSSLTGTFGGSVNNNSNRSYPFTYTISSANTWEQKTITIAGDTSGTWATGNTTGLLLEIGLGVGSTYSGTAGAWTGSYFSSATGATSVVGTNGATFYITGVQLEVGTTATSFDYRPYGTELALCQRYYQTVAGQVFNSEGYYNSAGYGLWRGTAWSVPMRAAPTITAPTTSASGNVGSLVFTGYINGVIMNASTTNAGNGYIYFTGNAIGSIEL